MSYFQLPNTKLNQNFLNKINPIYSEEINVKPCINKTLSIYLNKMKTEIDNKQLDWDKYKKYTNPYEFIHTTVPNSKQSVCKLRPLSRSFYKMIEMFNSMNLNNDLPNIYKTFHFAEGPGGFIEAMCFLNNNENNEYYGMTLINNEDENIPGWKKSKSFLKNNPNVYIEMGEDKTGNLMIANNLKFCYLKYHGQIDLVTADGGFDFSIDFNHQEAISAKLIFCQIAFAIAVQAKDGCLIIKFFDIFTDISIDMLYLLSNLYTTVDLVKPNTSRYANSEKYVVCKGFKLNNTEILIKSFYKIFQNFKDDQIILRIFDDIIPYYYKKHIEEINAIFGQQQIENITATFNLINNNKYDRLETTKKNNIQKCINWCNKYNLPSNKVITQTNIFLSNK